MSGIAQVLTALARDHGLTLAELAEEVERRECYEEGVALGVFYGDVPSCPMLVPVVSEILGLNEIGERWLHETVMRDGREYYRMISASSTPCAV